MDGGDYGGKGSNLIDGGGVGMDGGDANRQADAHLSKFNVSFKANTNDICSSYAYVADQTLAPKDSSFGLGSQNYDLGLHENNLLTDPTGELFAFGDNVNLICETHDLKFRPVGCKQKGHNIHLEGLWGVAIAPIGKTSGTLLVGQGEAGSGKTSSIECNCDSNALMRIILKLADCYNIQEKSEVFVANF